MTGIEAAQTLKGCPLSKTWEVESLAMEYIPVCDGYFRADTCPTVHPTPTHFSKKLK